MCITEPDGYAKVFITESVCTSKNPSSICADKGKGKEKADLYVEYIEWVTEKDPNYRVYIQLYE